MGVIGIVWLVVLSKIIHSGSGTRNPNRGINVAVFFNLETPIIKPTSPSVYLTDHFNRLANGEKREMSFLS